MSSFEKDRPEGDWNLAFDPDSWKRLFNLLPGAGQVLGLEWEPAHQIVQDLDPMVQFDDWSTKMFHRLRESGYSGSVDIEGYHDTDWNGENEISGQLRSLGYLRACRDGIMSGPNWIEEDIHR
jgi:sugar phosphate isomerase/epimerase